VARPKLSRPTLAGGARQSGGAHGGVRPVRDLQARASSCGTPTGCAPCSDPPPVQIIFAGKAHPADEPAKQVLQRVYALARDPTFEGRITFLEDYEMHLAHRLVQGVDLWLNVPRGPMEACGTSGMKAALNAVPQLGTPIIGGRRGPRARTAGPSRGPRATIRTHRTTACTTCWRPRSFRCTTRATRAASPPDGRAG
jgi:hypothetical protein